VSQLIDASGSLINLRCASWSAFVRLAVCNLRHEVIHFCVLLKSILERNVCSSASE